MALKTKKLSEAVGMQVYTDTAEFLGVVEEAVLEANKVQGWRVRSVKGSFLEKALSGARGVVIPHQLVRAMGSIMIVSKSAAPSYTE